jgi:hypothetical protein
MSAFHPKQTLLWPPADAIDFVMDVGRAVALVMLLLFGGLAVYGLIAGKTRFWLSYSRDGQPVFYWAIVAVWLFMASAGAYRLVVGFPPQ